MAATHRTAYLLTGDPHEAEDLVQQTLVTVVTVVARWQRVTATTTRRPTRAPCW